MQRPDPPKDPIFSREFYEDIVTQMDPAQELTPESVALFGDLADDFMRSVFTDAFQLVRKREPKEDRRVEAEEIYFILQTKYGMSLPGPPMTTDSFVQGPTKEYQEKQNAVRTFAAAHRDD
jgi:transcription initiation factor TFIID subunit TAF12